MLYEVITHMKIGVKLAAGFGLVLALTLILGIVGVLADIGGHLLDRARGFLGTGSLLGGSYNFV